MKLSSQIQIRPNAPTRERTSGEASLLNILKGLFVKPAVTIIEETFSAPEILTKLSAAFKSSGITNLVRISHDETEFYLDKNQEPHDLDEKIEAFRETLYNSFERFYERISVIMEIQHAQIDFMIELEMTRIHPVGVCPVQIYITGVPDCDAEGKTEKKFKLFVEKIEQNICKYLETADLNISFSKTAMQDSDNLLTTAKDKYAGIKNTKDTNYLFFPLYGVTLGLTSIEELAQKGVKCIELDPDKKPYKYYKINDVNFWHNDTVATHIYLTYTSPLPPQWRNYGLDWSLSYNEWIKLFEKLGFFISFVHQPTLEWYNGQRTLMAEFHASKKISDSIQLTIEVYFNYSQKKSVDSKGTLYSLRFRVY